MMESLLEIKGAEEKAEKIISQAKTDMRRKLDDAESKRDEIYSTLRKKTLDEIKSLKEKTKQDAEKEALKITQDGEKELESLKKMAEKNFSKGVESAVLRVIE